MHAYKVDDLKHNPAAALRKAKAGPVIVLKGEHPEAVIFHLDNDSLLSVAGMRLALATALFKEGHIPLGRAARLAETPLAEFIRHLSRQGIPAIAGKAREVKADLEVLRKWRKSS